MSYQITISPSEIDQVLKKHILKDGYNMTLDLEKSHGVYMFDSKYNRDVLDFFTCFATVPIGYNHPKMLADEAFKNSLFLAALTNPSNSDLYTTQFAHFLQTFERVAKRDYLPHSFFVAGGTLGVENALKVAMDWKVQKNFQKGYTKEVGTKVLHFQEGFHGRSGYSLSITNTDQVKIKYFPKFNDWPRILNPKINFPYTDTNHDELLKREALAVEQIKRAFQLNPDEICCIIIEPIQAEGGDNHFRKEFFEALRLLCDENEVLLIYDEVQTGVGLTGKFWAHELFGEKARPDIIAFGKKMQVCGILVGTKIDDIETNCFKVSGRINSTWGGSLVDMVRADKYLEIIEEDKLVENAAIVGDYFLERLLEVGKKFKNVTNIRGRGLFCAFDLPTTEIRNQFIVKGLEHNVMFLGCSTRTIRFRPALILEKQHVDKCIEVLFILLKELGI